MATFDYVQVGNGPITLTCRGCGHRTTVQKARFMQRTIDRHVCGRSTTSASAHSARR
ncbi:hypothetical protein OHA46_33760 (plasmid) [Streptomyces sp. NBC_00708]